MKIINKKYRKHWDCLQGVIWETFNEKKILFQFFIAFIFLILGVISNISIPMLLKKIVESFSTSTVVPIALILISYGLIWMFSQILLHIRTLLIYKVEQRITYILGIKVLSHLYALSHNYFINQKSGTLTNVIRRAQRDVPSIILGIFFHVIPTVLEFIFVVAIVSTLYPLQYSFFLSLILISFFTYTIFLMKFSLKDRKIANEVDKEADGIVSDWLSNHEAVKLFGKRDLAIDTCKKELKKRETAEIKFMSKLSYFRFGQSFILGTGLSFFTYLVGNSVVRGDLSIGDFVLFNGYILQFIIPINILGQIIQNIKNSLLDLNGIIEILLTESEIKEVLHPVHLSGEKFQIEFENVSFTYSDRTILRNASFSIESGETVLILGPTGTGKSTIAKLLLRLYDTMEGQILINKSNIKHLSFRSLYDSIGWIPQETYLLNSTIKNNICFACPNASNKDIEEALYNANLLDFVKRLPDGINTFVGDKGLKLSSGEKQRLSLARIFLKKPKICIFDEATSFLDRQAELLIQKNIETFLHYATKIIITHRPFMINAADKVLMLSKNGCIEQKSKFSPRDTNFFFKTA